MTDPDYAGKRIRNIIEKNIPTAKHAYISNKKQWITKGKANWSSKQRGYNCCNKKLIIHPMDEGQNDITNELLIELGLVGRGATSKILESSYWKELI